jgi:short-subunit dehydrogenase
MTNRIALITGASSGIGAAFAYELASRNHDVILGGRRADKLEAVAQACRDRYNVKAEVVIAELTRHEEVAKLVRRIHNPGIDVLVNNAGFGLSNSFIKNPIDQQHAMVEVHVQALLTLTHAALPHMREQGKGLIINVSSLAAFLPMKGSGLYCGTKAFINAFSESLHMEEKANGIRVLVVCPGFTHTDFHEKIGIPRERQKNGGVLRWMEADDVVKQAFRALDRGVVVYVPGLWNRFIRRCTGALPRRLYYAIFSRFTRDEAMR